MPQVLMRNSTQDVIVTVEVDSMGRTPELVKAMEDNAPKRVVARGVHASFAQMVAQQCQRYPRVMYKLALKKGVPSGDEIDPGYPMPYDLAQSIGHHEKGFLVVGKSRESVGNVIRRHPYRTVSCGVLRPDYTLDFEASERMEKQLLAEGWVDSLSKVEGLPVMTTVEEPFDEPPSKATAKAK